MKIDGKLLYNVFHNLLKGLQGGQEGEYYHLTKAEWEKTPSRPFIVSPENGATNINQVPLIKGTAYYHPYNLPMFRRDIQIATDIKFQNIIYELDNNDDKFSASTEFQIFPKQDGSYYFLPGTTYYVRIRYQDKNEHWSEWSEASFFTTMLEFPDNALLAPIMIIPTDGGIVRAKDPIFAMSTAKMLVGATIIDKANWQIAANSNFDPLLYEAIETNEVTLHQANNLNLTTTLGTDFYVRGQQGTVEGDWSPWTTVHFGIRPDYEDLVFGVRKLFSKKYSVPFVWNIDPEGNIVSIPKKYWNNHPMYVALNEEMAVDMPVIEDSGIVNSMIFIPPCYMKYRVYDNNDGDMVIDTWYSPTPQTEDGWRLDMAFTKNTDGFYLATCLGNIATNNYYASEYNKNAYASNPVETINVIKNTQSLDEKFHLWTIYERRLLMDLMIAEYATLDPLKISMGYGINNTITSFVWRGFRGLILGAYNNSNLNSDSRRPIVFSGVKRTIANSYITKIQVMTPDGGNWMPYDANVMANNSTFYAADILRGESDEMGFNVALLGIVSQSENANGRTTSPYGMALSLLGFTPYTDVFSNMQVQDGLFGFSGFDANYNTNRCVRMARDYS